MPETKSQNRPIGYAGVSTYGQTLDAQLEQLRKAGCAKIFREKVTGARADRRELLKLLRAITPGDVVTVTRIDRLARSTFDLFAIVKQIVDAGGAIPVTGGTVGRHRHQHRAIDDCRSRRPSGRGARSNPHPHGGRARAGQGARAAHGPTAETHAAAAERSTAAAGRRGNAQGTGEKLQCRASNDFKDHAVTARLLTTISINPVYLSQISLGKKVFHFLTAILEKGRYMLGCSDGWLPAESIHRPCARFICPN